MTNEGEGKPEKRIRRRFVETAEAIALGVVRKGNGHHPLDPACGYGDSVTVAFHLDDLHRITVNLLVEDCVMYSFNLEVKILGQHPNPDELWDSGV